MIHFCFWCRNSPASWHRCIYQVLAILSNFHHFTVREACWGRECGICGITPTSLGPKCCGVQRTYWDHLNELRLGETTIYINCGSRFSGWAEKCTIQISWRQITNACYCPLDHLLHLLVTCFLPEFITYLLQVFECNTTRLIWIEYSKHFNQFLMYNIVLCSSDSRLESWREQNSTHAIAVCAYVNRCIQPDATAVKSQHSENTTQSGKYR